MALIIDKPTVYGPNVLATYWRPMSYSVNAVRLTAEVSWGGWADESARANNAPLTTHVQTVQTDALAPVMQTEFGGSLFAATFAGLYALGRTDPFFAGAIDG